MATNTFGGGVDPLAAIGRPPESRGWKTGDRAYEPVIAPTARIEAFATVDAGVERETIVDEQAWLFKHSHAGHDSYIGARAEVCTGAIIGGYAVIHADAKIGLGAIVLPYRTVGAGAVLGAGSVLTKDIPAGETWAGNPARKLEDSERDPRPHTERSGDDLASVVDGFDFEVEPLGGGMVPYS